MDEFVLEERLKNMNSNLKESFDRVHGRQDKTDRKVDSIKVSIDSMLSPATMRWSSGILIGAIVSFGIYLNAHVVAVEKENIEHVAKSDGWFDVVKKNEIQSDSNKESITEIAIIQARGLEKKNEK